VNIARGFAHAYPALLAGRADGQPRCGQPRGGAVADRGGQGARAAIVGIFHDEAARARVCDREIDVTGFTPGGGMTGGMLAAHPGLVRVQRAITRPADAGGEAIDGLSETAFAARVQAGGFALHWRAHGLRYGIPVEIDAQRARAAAVVVNLSRAVLAEAQERFGDLRVIALSASRDALAARLAERGRESAEAIRDRLDRAQVALPPGLRQVYRIDNSGPLAVAVTAALAVLQPERA
jgi:ribose 1,5-bisphosphokinase